MSSALRSTIMCLAATALLGVMSPARAAINGGEKHAIVIGVQRYSEAKGFAPLRYAERDAQAFYDLLVDPQRGGYDEACVKLFTTGAADQDQWPVRGNILAALNQLEEWARLAPDNTLDTVLVYFSGHGLAQGGESYLIPSDASRNDLASTAISLDDLRNRLERSGAKKQIIILDACRFQATPGKAAGDRQSVEFAQKLEALAEAEGRAVLVSCSENQASYEDDASGHSAFTKFLVEGLLGDADTDHDGTITLTESHEYAAAELLSWAQRRDLEQNATLYGELTLTVPLVRCPLWAELTITSVPSGAEIWIDEEKTGQTTPHTERIRLEGVSQRGLQVTLKKPGYQDLDKRVMLRAGGIAEIGLSLEERPTPAARHILGVRACEPGAIAKTFYCHCLGSLSGLAPRADGGVLVAVPSGDPASQGIYLAYEGDDWDAGDAFAEPGPPFHAPRSVLLRPDGQVIVTDPEISTIWAIHAPGRSPEVLTQDILEPHDVLLAAPGFDGPDVKPGDLLVCAGGAGDPTAGGLYVVDQETLAVRHLVGPPDLDGGLRSAAFGPDGVLYAMETDAARDGLRVVTISPDGQVAPFLTGRIEPRASRPETGPIAVDSNGDVYFAYGTSVARVSGREEFEPVMLGELFVADLAFLPESDSMLVSLSNGHIVRLAPLPPGSPRLDAVQLERGCTVDTKGRMAYRHSYRVEASDDDGAEDMVKLHVQTPEAVGITSRPRDGEWEGQEECSFAVEHSVSSTCPLNMGRYVLTVTDSEGNIDSVATENVPPVSEVYPELITPARDSVIHASVPAFAWTPGAPGATHKLAVFEEGATGPIWQVDVGEATEAVYNFDGTAVLDHLQPNHSYLWQVESWHPGHGTGLRLKIWTVHHVWGLFAVYGEWPAEPPQLPGKLAYEAWGWEEVEDSDVPAVLGYNTDPERRVWLGPGGSFRPDWSPDGTRLLYASRGLLYVDSVDGSDPERIMLGSSPSEVLEPVMYCRWSPDGERIAYSLQPRGRQSDAQGTRDYDIWVAHSSDSRRYPLVETVGCSERYPSWSPDGAWVAYEKKTGRRYELPDVEKVAQCLWLVRHDGSENRPLGATGVVGHPGYEVDVMAAPAWSPDGSKIAVHFRARLPEGRYPAEDAAGRDYIEGIGTIPRDGGAITPVFLAPSYAVCCAGPHWPYWSPDGLSIVFGSGHHLGRSPAWGEWEPGVELWLVNADGSGEPVRLTYDRSVNTQVSWWAPNTEIGMDVTITKGDMSVTFGEVLEPGSTSLTVLGELPRGGLTPDWTIVGDCFEMSTDAEIAGTITVEIRYEDHISPEWENRLSLLQYGGDDGDDGDKFMDITIRPIDTQRKVIRGKCAGLGTFVLSVRPEEGDTLARWADSLLERAETMMDEEAGQLFARALQRWDDALAIEPDSPRALTGSGLVLHRQALLEGVDADGTLLARAAQKYEAALAAKPDYHAALVFLGETLVLQAGRTGSEERARLLAQASEKYEAARAIRPDSYSVLVNWAEALRRQADATSGGERSQLLAQASEKLEAAVAIRPDAWWLIYNCGTTFLNQADETTEGEREQLLVRAGEKFEAALAIWPRNWRALTNWGLALRRQADGKSEAECDQLLAQAAEKFEAALALQPRHVRALVGWGNTLLEQQKGKNEDERDQLLAQAAEKFEAARAIEPDSWQALERGGVVLCCQAKGKSEAEREQLFIQASEKFEAAVNIKPDSSLALARWETALLRRSKTKTGGEAEALLRLALEKAEAAYNIEPGVALAAYNAACAAALLGDEDECRKWLARMQEAGTPLSQDSLLNDPDLESLRDREWVRAYVRPDEAQSTPAVSGELRWQMGGTLAQAISPVSSDILFSREHSWPPTQSDILKSNMDGSDEVNLTEAAGIGGVNCSPTWSPNGAMIAFQHCDPVDALLPCKAGFHAWVMNADGSDAHPLLPEGSGPSLGPIWSPDGSRLVVSRGDPWDLAQPGIVVDLSGAELAQVLPGERGPCCPEGRPLAFVDQHRGEVDGQAGWWNRLIVEDADGTNRRTAVEQFIADADLEERYPTQEQLDSAPDLPWLLDVRNWVGPGHVIHSPDHSTIAFLAALPFDPDGLFYKDQVEVWVYDLATGELTKVTDDDVQQHGLVWE